MGINIAINFRKTLTQEILSLKKNQSREVLRGFFS